MNPKEYFENKRYVYLSSVISKEDCAKITEHMWKLKEEGKLEQDPQCPLSWSIYGDSILDNILVNLAPALSKQLGIDLLPTYTYARIYQPGEVLKRHVDRESCEISGTLTLGHDSESEIWPIYFSADPQDVVGQAINIDVGDMVMYRGNELTHWRPEYRGRWQTQVFFHYVNANGPHKDWAFDKREAPGTQKRVEPKWNKIIKNGQPSPQASPVSNVTMKNIYNSIMIDVNDNITPDAVSFHEGFKSEWRFTPEECDKIIEIAKKQYPEKARVGAGDDGKYADNIRRVDQYKVPVRDDTKWIFERIAGAVATANEEYFKFEIAGITHELQLLHYKSVDKGFYDWHVDVGPGSASKRKISVVCMLSDPEEYQGGKLIVNANAREIECINSKGSINMFPSYALHTVTPVTEGERWVLVIWVHGSQRFK